MRNSKEYDICIIGGLSLEWCVYDSVEVWRKSAHRFPRVRPTHQVGNLDVWMERKHADEFCPGITAGADDAHARHTVSPLMVWKMRSCSAAMRAKPRTSAALQSVACSPYRPKRACIRS